MFLKYCLSFFKAIKLKEKIELRRVKIKNPKRNWKTTFPGRYSIGKRKRNNFLLTIKRKKIIGNKKDKANLVIFSNKVNSLFWNFFAKKGKTT